MATALPRISPNRMGEPYLQSSKSAPSLAPSLVSRASSKTLKSRHPCSNERSTARDVLNQSMKNKAVSVSCANLEGMLKRVDPSWTRDEICFHMSIILNELDRLLKHVGPGKETVSLQEVLDDTRHSIRITNEGQPVSDLDCPKIKAQMMSYEKQNQTLREKNEKLEALTERMIAEMKAKDKEARSKIVQARTQANLSARRVASLEEKVSRLQHLEEQTSSILWSLEASMSEGERLRKALAQSQASDKEARELLREARELLVQAHDGQADVVADLAARAEASDFEAERRQEALERLLEQDRTQLAQTRGEAMLSRQEALERLLEQDRTLLAQTREAMPTKKVANLESQLAEMSEFSPEEAFANEMLEGEPKQYSYVPSMGL